MNWIEGHGKNAIVETVGTWQRKVCFQDCSLGALQIEHEEKTWCVVRKHRRVQRGLAEKNLDGDLHGYWTRPCTQYGQLELDNAHKNVSCYRP